MIRHLVGTVLLLASMPNIYAEPIEPQVEQALHIQFRGPAATELFRFLGGKATLGTLPNRESNSFDIRGYGESQDLGCSEYRECYVSVYEKEWILDQNNGLSIFKFWKSIDQTILEGTIQIDTINQSIRFKWVDLQNKDEYSSSEALLCPQTDDLQQALPDNACHYTLQNRIWKLERRESNLVVERTKKITLAIRGEAAKALYRRGPKPKVTQTFPQKAWRTTLGERTYCFYVPDHTKGPYHCQAELLPQPTPATRSFAANIKPSLGFTLTMQPSFTQHMLDSYSLSFKLSSGKVNSLTTCGPQPIPVESECQYWNDLNNPFADVSIFPLTRDGGGGIAIGFGKEGTSLLE